MKPKNWNVKSYGILQHTFVALGVLGKTQTSFCIFGFRNKQTKGTKNPHLLKAGGTLECNWSVTLIPRLLNVMNFRDILLWDLKGKRNFASSLTIKSQKVYFRTFDNVKDLAKLLEINDIVKFLILIILKSHKKQRPKTPLLTSLSMFDKRNK